MAIPVYIDDAYVGNAIGTSRRDSLLDASGRTQHYQAATGVIRKALKNAGYSPPSEAELATLDLDSPVIRLATLGEALVSLYGQVGAELPPQFNTSIALRNAIINGTIEFEQLAPNERDAVGGSATRSPTQPGSISTVDLGPVYAEAERFL